MRLLRCAGANICIILALIGVSRSLCAGEVPSWYEKVPFEEGALFGVGSAKDPAEAQEIAKADIAGQLMTSLTSERESQKRQESVYSSEGGDRRVIQTAFRQTISTQTQARYLPGAEVMRQERVGERFFVLVRLDKERFRTAAMQRIQQIDEQLGKLAAKPARITGARIAALRRALPLAEERDALALTLAGLGTPSQPSPLPVESVRAQLGLLITPGTIVCRANEATEPIREAIEGVLADLDLAVVEPGKEARFELKLAQKQQQSTLPNGWVKCQLSGAITVINLESGETIGSLSASETATFTHAEGALSKAREKLIAALSTELQQKLLPILIRGVPE
ncbi:MAG: LPP20 family lipoprotein [Rhodocyclaceae bacterium]|nr:LPP20 family lipoprotein [Rhodocyclaceae bacterium]